ncbi:MAG: thioredoxin-dependent thiol peroxidase [Leptospiraceae bacterium]|nr:thioredoxin-dependent thiol peroxidase [Leptospiraceae bacterium]MCP5512469.1 thioredoxin-dependent thiol peroxidase [Leptospiraceae bacterium]
MSLEVGKKAPNFTAINTKEEKVKLSDRVGKKGLVLYFYPRDNTPGCTTEACDFRDHFEDLKKLGYSILGVSKDSPQSHKKFTDKFSLNFDLIADTDGKICEQYGVWQEKKFMGKTSMGIVRTTFLIDSNLKILKIYPGVKVKEHVQNIIQDIKSL